MTQPNYPKPLGFLLVIQLIALMGVLFFTVDEIWDGIAYVIGIQLAAVVLGGACVALPSAKGRQREMLDILGAVMIVPIIAFLLPYFFADEFLSWSQQDIRIFSMLTFYATAFPMIFIGLVVLREGWVANPKSARVLFFMNLFFLLGVIGKLETDRAVESGVLLGAIQFAAIMSMLVLLRLPILAGWRWQFFGLGAAAFVGPIVLGYWKESHNVFFGTAILLNALALFILRDKELPDESRSRGGRLFIGLNMLAPLGLFFLCMDWTRRGSRDEELLLIVPGVLFALGVAMLFPIRAKAAEGEDIKDFLPSSLLREAGAVSFLAGAAMVSIVVLLADAQRNDRDEYIFYGYALLFLNTVYLFIRGFFLRMISEAARLFIRRWTPRMGVVLVLLLLAWVANGWLAKRMWIQHKAAGEADGWKYNREHYIGNIPANEDNFFMALPFYVYAYRDPQHGMPSIDAFFWDELPEPEPIDFSDPPQGMMPGMMPPPPNFQPGMMQPEMSMMPPAGVMGMSDQAMPAPVSRREVDALLDRAPFIARAVQSEIFLNWRSIAQTLRADMQKGDRMEYFGEKPESGLTDEELLDRYFGQFDKMFSALSRAAKRPEHHLPLYYRGINTPLSHIMAMKRTNWLLKYSALSKLDEGDVEGAMADIRLQVRVFEAGGSGQFTISQLGHAGYGALIVETVNACLHSGKLSNDHMDELKELLTLDKDYLGQFERSQQIERITTGPLFIEKLIEGEDMEIYSKKMEEALRLSSKRRLYNDLIYYDTKMKDYLILIREAKETGHIEMSKVEALFNTIKMETSLKGYMFSRTLLPALSKSMKRMGAVMNRFSAARLGLALEQYRLANGKLPDELEALTPEYLPSLPKDVFSAERLKWERSGIHRYRIPVSDRSGEIWEYDPILAAIQLGDIEALEKMAKEGWEITTPEPGREAQYKQLLKLGESQPPDPNYLDVPESMVLTQKEAIKLAIAEGHDDMARWLVEHKIEPSFEELHAAVRQQQVDLVKLFLDSGMSPIEPTDLSQKSGRLNNDRETLFEMANAEILPLLLAKVPKEHLSKVLKENQPGALLKKTLAKRDLAKARLLIEHGASLEDSSLIESFLNQPEENRNRSYGYSNRNTPKARSTPLEPHEVEFVEYLIQQGVSVGSSSLLKLATQSRDLPLVKLLIKYGAPITTSRAHPAVIASTNPDSAMLKLLMELELKLEGPALEYAAEAAASAGLFENFKLLEEAGAIPDSRDLVTAAFRGGNLDLIIHMAEKAGNAISDDLSWSSAGIEFDSFISMMLETDSLEAPETIRPSGMNGEETFVEFLNRSGQTVQLVWLSGEGGRRKYDTIQEDSNVIRQTFENHVWLIETINGKPLGVYQAKKGDPTVLIGGGNRRSKPTDQNLPIIRNLAKLLIENGIKSKLLKPEVNADEITWETLEAGLNKKKESQAVTELIGIDEDGDGFDAFDEQLTGHSDNDPNDQPTQEEVDAAIQTYERVQEK